MTSCLTFVFLYTWRVERVACGTQMADVLNRSREHRTPTRISLSVLAGVDGCLAVDRQNEWLDTSQSIFTGKLNPCPSISYHLFPFFGGLFFFRQREEEIRFTNVTKDKHVISFLLKKSLSLSSLSASVCLYLLFYILRVLLSPFCAIVDNVNSHICWKIKIIICTKLEK